MCPKYIQPAREPAQAQRRAHARGFLVAAAHEHQRAVNLVEEFLQHVGEPGFQAVRALPEGSRQQARDLFHRDAAGKFPGHRAAHAVAHREDEIRARRRGVADPPEVTDLAARRIAGRGNCPRCWRAPGRGRSGRTSAGDAERRLYGQAASRLKGGNVSTDAGGGTGPAGSKSVANSKSITQNRPSRWR